MAGIKYTLRLATEREAEAIYDLVFRDPPPFVRQRPSSEVTELIRAGTMWIACDASGLIVAACYIMVPEAVAGSEPPPAEWGGLFVHPETRRAGLGSAMGTMALACFFWDHDPDSDAPPPLIGHVHKENPGPRKILAELSFRHDREIEVPAGTEGFERMPRNADGKLIGDEFVYPTSARASLFRKMAALLRLSTLRDGTQLAIEASLGMTADELDTIASRLERPG